MIIALKSLKFFPELSLKCSINQKISSQYIGFIHPILSKDTSCSLFYMSSWKCGRPSEGIREG